ncbi:Acyltransferase [Caenorhabditis elegans]|uniref:Acyltransferase n=1 Tax=Caenorhabditis elegans TaxID=6239 RepID=O45617_CAEEL|nr:Acyltransferase [Caenorhabditis elegans]CAB11538.2 Acyltransferase [Caenorhabditis elegans]|eukprot:NP_502710.2 O-ACyltransferase homolog [Caenorhabditis elegans]
MRVDIQCLRGLAILFVFLFHLFPFTFVNGYLGVDIFFVISGYLMARNLTHSKIQNVWDIFKFYYRRFRRILPLYYLFIPVTLVFVHLFLGEFWWGVNRRYSVGAFFLVSNQVFIHDAHQYFHQYLADGTSINAFIHTWSLGVEMQFYLLVPFIMFGLQFLNSPLLKLIAVILTTFIGMWAFLLINAQFSFNFMFLRLWQFSAGFTALFWRDFEKCEKAKSTMKIGQEPSSTYQFLRKDDVAICTIAILFLCILPAKLDEIYLRPLITLTAAYLFYLEDSSCKLLRSTFLKYMGDISYVLYLVHWPVITFFKSTTVTSNIFCIVLTFIITIIVHHFFEKQYLKFDFKSIILLLTFLLAVNAFVQWSTREHQFWKPTYIPRTQKIVEENLAMLPFISAYEPRKDKCVETSFQELVDNGYVFDYCNYPKANGNLSVMALGNSYVLNFNDHIRSQFNYNYSEWRSLFVRDSFGFFYDGEAAALRGSHSKSSLVTMRNLVQLHKPDILFLISRYSDYVKGPILNEETDRTLEKMNNNIAFYEKYVQKIYILAPHPLYPLNFMNSFLQYVTRKPRELETLHLKKDEVDEEWMYARERFSLIKCKKCKVFDLGEVFLDNEKYLTFDRQTKLSYVDNGIHLTGPAVKKCDPVFKNIATEVMMTVKRR